MRLVEAEPFFFPPFSRASHQGVDRRKFKPFANPDTNQTVAAVCVDRLTIPLSLSLSLSLALSPYSAEEQVLTLVPLRTSRISAYGLLPGAMMGQGVPLPLPCPPPRTFLGRYTSHHHHVRPDDGTTERRIPRIPLYFGLPQVCRSNCVRSLPALVPSACMRTSIYQLQAISYALAEEIAGWPP